MRQNILIRFGRRIRSLRKERGLTQERLAELTNLHHNYIGMIERGERNPSLVNIEILAKAFDLQLSELFIFGDINETT